MGQTVTGVYRILSNPVVYEVLHQITGARRWMKQFIQNDVKPRETDTVIDVGCGPAEILSFLPNVEYIGFDLSPEYIKAAENKYSDRGIFVCDNITNFSKHDLPKADIVIAIGLLHHLNDDHCMSLMRDIKGILKPEGRMITADPCYHDRQNVFSRLFVNFDRGMHVRNFQDYESLARKVWPIVNVELADEWFYISSVAQMTCRLKQ